jgi:hypothetical protein
MGQMDNVFDAPEIPEAPIETEPLEQTVDYISNEYIGAPDKVWKFN